MFFFSDCTVLKTRERAEHTANIPVGNVNVDTVSTFLISGVMYISIRYWIVINIAHDFEYISNDARKIAPRYIIAFYKMSDGSIHKSYLHVYCDIIDCVSSAACVRSSIDPVAFHAKFIKVLSYIMLLHAYRI